MSLQDHIILITGSSHGIGKTIAETFLQEQAKVIITGRNESILTETVQTFSQQYGNDNVLYFCGDLQQETIVAKLANFIKQIGKLDHLVCNIGSGRSVPPLQEDKPEFQRVININLLNAVSVVTHFTPLLKRSITFIGSICGMETLGCPVAYASAKAGLESYAKNIAKPLGQKGIRVNIVSPGNILFPGSTWEQKLTNNRAAVETMLEQEVPLKKLGSPTDIANAVVFLASERASFVTGANWVIDGGQVRNG